MGDHGGGLYRSWPGPWAILDTAMTGPTNEDHCTMPGSKHTVPRRPTIRAPRSPGGVSTVSEAPRTPGNAG